MNTRFTIAIVSLLAMAFCFLGMAQAAGDNMPPPGQRFQALQDQLDKEVFPFLVPTGVISKSAGSLDDISDKLLAAKGEKPGKPPGGNGEESDYKVTDLGTLDGGKKSSSAARDISGNGLVVGWSDDGQQTLATLWTVSSEGDINGVEMLDGQTSSEANAINQDGTMVAGHAGTIEYSLPVYWVLPSGSIHNLPRLTDFSDGVAYDVNNDEKIAGYCRGFGGDPYAYAATLWDGTSATELPSLGSNGESSMALGINNNGDVVGMSYVDNEPLFHAALWMYNDDDSYQVCDLHVGDYDYKSSRAHAITDRKNGRIKIAGERHSSPAGIPLATVWIVDLSEEECVVSVADTQDLGEPAYAADINSAGEVVGQDHSTRSTQPVVWPSGNENEMVVLPLLKGGSGIAEGISSDGGQIVGWSEVRGGKHAVLWTKKD